MTRTIPLKNYRVTITDTGYQTHEHAPLNVWCEVTRTEDNQEVWSGYQHHDPARLNMLPAILARAFPPSMMGYPGLFIGEGFALCHACGIASLQNRHDDDPGQFTIDWSYQDSTGGLSCDACGGWAYDPHCPECGKYESDLETALVYNDSGDHCVCRQCIADALTRTRMIDRCPYSQTDLGAQHYAHSTRAHLIAPGTYELSNCWYADTYRTPAANELAPASVIDRRTRPNSWSRGTTVYTTPEGA